MNKVISKVFIGAFLCLQLLFAATFLLRFDDKVDLNGASSVSPFPEFTTETLMNGELGYKYNLWFADNFPFRSIVIKVYNQFKYTALNEIGAGWIVGRDGWMYNAADSTKVIIENRMNSDEQIEEYAAKVAAIQNVLLEQGKDFVYILTPAKAYVYEENLPLRFRELDAVDKDSDYELLRAAFDRNGVRYYDFHEDLPKLKDKMDVFYKTGHHWTLQACATVINDMMQKIWPDKGVPTITVAGYKDEMYEKDDDILVVSNLYNYDGNVDYKSPIIEYGEKTVDNKLFIFGTSNGVTIFNALTDGEHAKWPFETVYFHEYFVQQRIGDANGRTEDYFFAERDIELYNFLPEMEASQFIIFEQQAEAGVMDTHVKFINWLYDKYVAMGLIK